LTARQTKERRTARRTDDVIPFRGVASVGTFTSIDIPPRLDRVCLYSAVVARRGRVVEHIRIREETGIARRFKVFA
jgi:hypothetical protein